MGCCLVRNVVALPLLAFALTACGNGFNFNQIFGKEDDGADSLLDEAKADYDRGDFENAASKCNTLLMRNPDNENAAILLGYIALSQGASTPMKWRGSS